MTPTSSSLGRRLRGLLFGELPLWGLRRPVRVAGTCAEPEVEAESDDDRLVALGYLHAHEAMLPLDLLRRLWSGRLAELFGEGHGADYNGDLKPTQSPACDLALPLRSDLDVFTRCLGFRWNAERTFRALKGNTAHLDHFAAGINGWIDSAAWRQQDCWRAVDSRPRLWAPADTLLLLDAENSLQHGQLDGRSRTISAADTAEVTEQWALRLQTCWDELRAASSCIPDIRKLIPKEFFARSEGWARTTPAAWPVLKPIEILSGGDNHRFLRSDGSAGRLHARRQDIELRREAPRRHWVRRAGSEGLISDLLIGAEGPLAPAGPGLLWSWETASGDERIENRRAAEEARRLPDLLGVKQFQPVEPLRPTRLVPLGSGGW